MREKVFAANWKMHKTVAETEAFFQEFVNFPGVGRGHTVAIFPPFTALHAVKNLVGALPIVWGAQNMYSKDKGAFTGEIAAPMLLELGCTQILIGHSERREVFKETDAEIREKIGAAHRHSLRPTICVGETLTERQAGGAKEKVVRQMASALDGLTADQAAAQSFAYEPIWAIGTGQNASAADAQEMCALVREEIGRRFGESVSSSVPVLYGGSVKADNIAQYIQQRDVDGALIGGASLEPASFISIIRNGLEK